MTGSHCYDTDSIWCLLLNMRITILRNSTYLSACGSLGSNLRDNLQMVWGANHAVEQMDLSEIYAVDNEGILFSIALSS